MDVHAITDLKNAIAEVLRQPAPTAQVLADRIVEQLCWNRSLVNACYGEKRLPRTVSLVSQNNLGFLAQKGQTYAQ